MTPPMTRPVTPAIWFVVMGMLGMLVAMPFGRREGLLGWLAFLWVAGFAIGLLGLMIVTAARRFVEWYRDKSSGEDISEKGVCYDGYRYKLTWDRERFCVRTWAGTAIVDVPLSELLDVVDTDALFLENEVKIKTPRESVDFPKSRSQRAKMVRLIRELLQRDIHVRQEVIGRRNRLFRQGVIWLPLSLLLAVTFILVLSRVPEPRKGSLVLLAAGLAIGGAWWWLLWRFAYGLTSLGAAWTLHAMLRPAKAKMEEGDRTVP